MVKIPENKTRKRLRLTLCTLYLIQIFLCTMPYIQGNSSDGKFYAYTVFDMILFWGGNIPDTAAGSAFQTYILFMPVFFIIPIVGFFFCALDKERNMKNIASIVCCLLGVLSILIILGYSLSLGSMISLLLYLVICFLTTMSMFARITDNSRKN